MYYLKKYQGKYRVKADYDLDTNDFPRTDKGGIEPSFDDLYIECKNGIKIRHGVGNVLSCYIPSKGTGTNTLRKIYKDNISENLPSENGGYSENLCKKLVETETLVSAEVLDGEVYFEFKAVMLDYIAKIVGAKTNGANISPFSEKNLPKTKYKIPDSDMKLYKEAIRNFPTRIVNIGGKESVAVDGLFIKKLNSEFDEVIKKHKGKKFDVNKDRKLKGLSGKEYIHSLNLWGEYCVFMKENGERNDCI